MVKSFCRGRFQVQRTLKHDSVYVCKDIKMDSRLVVLKVIAVAKDNRSYLIEKEVLNQISHDNIVTLYDVIQNDQQFILVMEFIDGEYLADQDFSFEEILKIGIDISSALAYLHDLGVVHRDVKSANILYNERAKLIDFGIVNFENSRFKKEKNRVENLDYTGTMLYSSPEQDACMGESSYSDIYSLGSVLYELITGSYYKLDSRNLEIEINKALDEFGESVRLKVKNLLERMLLKEPTSRPNALTCKAELEAIYSSLSAPIVQIAKPAIKSKLFAVAAIFIFTCALFVPWYNFNGDLQDYLHANAITVFEEKGPEAAEPFFKVASYERTEDVDAYIGLAKCAYHNSDFDEGKEHLTAALQYATTNKEFGKIYSYFLNIALKEKEVNRVYDYLELASEFYNKTGNESYIKYIERKRAEVYMWVGEYGKAIDAYLNLGQNPLSNSSSYNLALCYNAINDYEEADRLLSSLITKLSQDNSNRLYSKAINARGWSLLQRGKHEEALLLFQESNSLGIELRLAEVECQALINIAHYHLASENKQQAKLYIAMAEAKIAVMGNDAMAYERLSSVKLASL